MRLNSNYRKKKGSLLYDSVFFIIILASIALIWYVTYRPFDNIMTAVKQTEGMSAQAINILEKNQQRYAAILDNSYLTITLVLWLVLLVSVYYIDSHPLFFGVSLFFFGIIIVVGAMISNGWIAIFDSASMAATQQALPKIYFIISKLPFVVLAVLFSMAIVSYAKVNQ